jgi:hypothetical protein
MNSVRTLWDKLIIFDYSGTLSLEASRFARPENLVRALEDSGLAALGVATPELFWDQIVGPTWVKGSTTQAGYKKVMAERIAALRTNPDIPPARIEAAAARFIESYLGQSRIDPLWRPALVRLNGQDRSLQIVATDHYAEATAAIIGHLNALAIPAMPLGRGGKPGHPSFSVANSADLGAWKADRRFREILKAQLPRQTFRGLLVVDDFGLNEEAGDLYGLLPKVTARQEKTLAVLREVFETPVDIFPFFLASELKESETDRARRIAEAAAHIERFLE